MASHCESCELFRVAARLGEAIDVRIAAAAYGQAQYGADHPEVQRAWRVVEAMERLMQATHNKARALARVQHAEHAASMHKGA